jgi:hypothetical protein
MSQPKRSTKPSEPQDKPAASADKTKAKAKVSKPRAASNGTAAAAHGATKDKTASARPAARKPRRTKTAAHDGSTEAAKGLVPKVTEIPVAPKAGDRPFDLDHHHHHHRGLMGQLAYGTIYAVSYGLSLPVALMRPGRHG